MEIKHKIQGQYLSKRYLFIDFRISARLLLISQVDVDSLEK
jgi:hypothetical protein